MFDLYNQIDSVQLLEPQSINDTDTYSDWLDTTNLDGVVIDVLCGTFTGVDADSYVELFLQEGDDSTTSGATAVAVADMIRSTTGLSSTSTSGLFATINSTAEDSVSYRVGYLGTKKYVRVKLDFTTGSGGVSAALVAVLATVSKARKYPVAGPTPVAAT